MTALVIGAGAESIYAIETAQSMGYRVLAFDGDASAAGLPVADEAYVVDIRKPGLIIDVLDKRGLRPDIVLPVPVGSILTAAGTVNDHYGLRGVSESTAVYCTDKWAFHNRLHEYGLREIECRLVPAGKAGIRFFRLKSNPQNDNGGVQPSHPVSLNSGSESGVNSATDLSFPCIVKPRYGSGSRAVHICRDESTLSSIFLSHMPYDEDFVIEGCVPGTEYGLDGAVQDGEFTLVLLREKLQTPPPYAQCVGYYSVTDNHLQDKATQLIRQCASVLGLRDGLLHADLIYDGNEMFVIEMSARPSGHYLHNKFTVMATGVDMVREYLTPRAGYTPRATKTMLIRYFDFENIYVTKVPEAVVLMRDYPVRAFVCNILGKHLGPVTDGHSLMDRGYVVIEGGTRHEIEVAWQGIRDSFDIG